ncbi:MAG: alpha-L-fucosidase [Treponema sp.]|jgi:hypothetical protein|nr:alpha-L-fucosidase [Treponema sp.]
MSWYTKNYRRNLVDMHIDGWDEEFLSRFDPEQYFRCLKKAQVTGPMIYVHSHAGWCNWPSASGEMHPGWKGENKIAKLFDLCCNAGMDVIAYYSLIYNNRVYLHHPEWRMIDIDGLGSRGDNPDPSQKTMMGGRGRYGLLCPNSKGYREYLKKQFIEITETYKFKGIFLDMTFWPMVCYCPACRARFREETGLDIPETVDWSDKNWLRFQKSREDWITEFALFATNALKELRPDIAVEHQYSTATHPWTYGITGSINEASDYMGGDLYGGFDQESFICKTYYGLTKNPPFEYMTSRCDPGLKDHTTSKSLEMLKLHAYLAYAHHGAFLAIDAIDPKGTLNEKFYETLGQVYDETKHYEPYYQGDLLADTAVYFSFASKMDRYMEPKRALLSGDMRGNPHLDSCLGSGRALRKARIPYRVLTDKDIPALHKNNVIVLSALMFISSTEEDALVKYVEEGGSLYMSGNVPGNLAQRLLGLELNGFTKEKVTYMAPAGEGEVLFDPYTKDYPLTIFGQQVIARNTKNHHVLAKVVLPYTDPADFTKFASIHSNPPGKSTSYPSVIYGNYGKGKVIWTAASFEASDQSMHRKVFISLVKALRGSAPDPVKTGAPEQVEIVLFGNENLLQIHCVNLQEQFPMIPIGPFTISVRCASPVKKVYLLPRKKEIGFTQNDNYLEFTVEGIDIFRMYQAEFA